MTYIKLLTALTTLALLTACGGGTAKTPDKNTDENTGENTGDNTENTDDNTDGNTGDNTGNFCVSEACVVNHADWLAGFTTATAPNPAGDNTRTARHEFLHGTADGLDVGNILRNTVTPAETRNLNLSLLGGQAADGAAWLWNGRSAGGAQPPRLAAGILSGTSLGAPLAPYTTGDTTAIWQGRMDWWYYSIASSGGSETTDRARVSNSGVAFDLTVNFQTRKIAAFIKRSTLTANTNYFLIRAGFDDTGRIDGSINHGTFAGGVDTDTPTEVTRGELTGLIGAEGAVGAFISDYTQAVAGGVDGATNNAFVGGFVAVPPSRVVVSVVDWLDSFTGDDALPTMPDATPINQFLAITETTASARTEAVPTTLSAIGTIGRGVPIFKGGAAFFTENSAYYAGILAGTNLGAPITETITNARWTGRINAVTNDGRVGLVGMDFGLVINFNGGTRTVKGMVHAGFGTRYFSIDGRFDEKGVIEGTVTYGHTTGTGDNIAFDMNHATYSPGNLTGIIGQVGAVGAFYSDNANPAAGDNALKYAGGFAVTPPVSQ